MSIKHLFFAKRKASESVNISQVGGITAVSLIGMARSGTSLVARMLNLCGLFLGHPKHMIPATPSNPQGHWELKEFVRVNDQLLKRFRGAWNRPPRLEPGWEFDQGLVGLHRKGERLIRKYFGAQKRWGWKDPRTSLTYSFWKRILPQLKSVICVRHPLDVAKSLELRDGIPVDTGLRLWFQYTISALNSTSPKERIITHYESYFMDFEKELLKIVSFVGLPLEDIPWEIVRSFCMEKLWHHRTGTHHEGTAINSLPEPIKALYDSLLNESQRILFYECKGN